MERYCSTGQTPQRAVAPTEEEEVVVVEEEEEEKEEDEEEKEKKTKKSVEGMKLSDKYKVYLKSLANLHGSYRILLFS